MEPDPATNAPFAGTTGDKPDHPATLPTVVNFLTSDERFVFSSYNVTDEAEAEREAAAALEQGIPCYYLVPTGDRYRPWRRVDVGLSE